MQLIINSMYIQRINPPTPSHPLHTIYFFVAPEYSLTVATRQKENPLDEAHTEE